jgi:hypothetical protein
MLAIGKPMLQHVTRHVAVDQHRMLAMMNVPPAQDVTLRMYAFDGHHCQTRHCYGSSLLPLMKRLMAIRFVLHYPKMVLWC